MAIWAGKSSNIIGGHRWADFELDWTIQYLPAPDQ